jgi:hypothetical protein
MSTTSRVRLAIATLVAVGVGGVSGVGFLGSPTSADPSPTGKHAAIDPEDSGVNERGHTYGSEIFGVDGKRPDLILVQMDSGDLGYVWATDLDGATRIEDVSRGGDGIKVLAAFESDGVTVIGSFTMTDEGETVLIDKAER